MTTVKVTKADDGEKVVGASDKDQKALAQFRKILSELKPGESVFFDYWFPRDKALHGWHFLVLSSVFEAQERFSDLDAFRRWCTVGAGYCDYLHTVRGEIVAVPRSIAYRKMDNVEFQAHHEKVVEFLRSERCTSALWPHLDVHKQADMIESILSEADHQRQEVHAARAGRNG